MKKLAIALILIVSSVAIATVAGIHYSSLGCFSNCSAAESTITVSSYSLRAGVVGSSAKAATSYFNFSLVNPGSQTYISSIILKIANNPQSGSVVTEKWGTNSSEKSLVNMQVSCTATVTVTDSMNSASTYTECAGSDPPESLVIPPHAQTSFVFFPLDISSNSTLITAGDSYQFVISFFNGQSVTGTVTAKSS